MTLEQRLLNELQDLPPEAQEKILKFVHFVKKELLVAKKGKPRKKAANALRDVDKFAVDTGISDLASQHDHYLYGVPKR